MYRSVLQRICLRNITVNRRYGSDAGLMLGQRRRRWPNIKPTLAQPLAFADSDIGLCLTYILDKRLSVVICVICKTDDIPQRLKLSSARATHFLIT